MRFVIARGPADAGEGRLSSVGGRPPAQIAHLLPRRL